mmetsp:Transcript_42143/g.70100  ORF Transcript_42143/g.70100 Transcript_42143/m.70100 type:complete len:103 (-) Transcript_42143:146-454(-)|eukprot:CAMPEP_0119332744 /NCGR_PEP_ID=MMETSP1333-20130426/83536_1 /TAXON_ID=418940 /ORGANISM="Scyphosphaera apsteinii, Strain RCC1455" /LENGTH=102 /DNA_ID=CAMNT_0007342643 /DNA_START=97 /DNA_END=405 /DNA_ORIENTATION=-
MVAGGVTLSRAVARLQQLALPHNVVAVGNTLWLFARAPTGETSPQFGASKLGSSEMAGCFHLPTSQSLDVAAEEGQMAAALRSASAPPLQVWAAVTRACQVV